jgi:quinol monooxygenase YgiN
MYGTIARLRVKPGHLEKLQEAMDPGRLKATKGMVSVHVYQQDMDSNELYMSVLFDNREAYRANAESKEQHQMYLEMMEHLETEPEWHDGKVIYSEMT